MQNYAEQVLCARTSGPKTNIPIKPPLSAGVAMSAMIPAPDAIVSMPINTKEEVTCQRRLCLVALLLVDIAKATITSRPTSGLVRSRHKKTQVLLDRQA